jgi:hypothetical protein
MIFSEDSRLQTRVHSPTEPMVYRLGHYSGCIGECNAGRTGPCRRPECHMGDEPSGAGLLMWAAAIVAVLGFLASVWG